MYEISVEACFNAVHRVPLPNGELEPLHGHDWKVRATFRGAELDAGGMVVDFIAAQRALEAAVRPLDHTDLGACPMLRQAPPTAEVVARMIFDLLASEPDLGRSLYCVAVVEAPGCRASYRRADRQGD